MKLWDDHGAAWSPVPVHVQVYTTLVDKSHHSLILKHILNCFVQFYFAAFDPISLACMLRNFIVLINWQVKNHHTKVDTKNYLQCQQLCWCPCPFQWINWSSKFSEQGHLVAPTLKFLVIDTCYNKVMTTKCLYTRGYLKLGTILLCWSTILCTHIKAEFTCSSQSGT
jgi:hypothetical protein